MLETALVFAFVVVLSPYAFFAYWLLTRKHVPEDEQGAMVLEEESEFERARR